MGAGLLAFFAFLAAGLRAALFFATTRFFLRAGAAFFARLAFFVFDFAFFAFFAMIDLPIVAAQISVRIDHAAAS